MILGAVSPSDRDKAAELLTEQLCRWYLRGIQDSGQLFLAHSVLFFRLISIARPMLRSMRTGRRIHLLAFSVSIALAVNTLVRAPSHMFAEKGVLCYRPFFSNVVARFYYLPMRIR